MTIEPLLYDISWTATVFTEFLKNLSAYGGKSRLFLSVCLPLSGTTSSGIGGRLSYHTERHAVSHGMLWIYRLVLGIWRFVRREPNVTSNHADVFCEHMNILLETIVVLQRYSGTWHSLHDWWFYDRETRYSPTFKIPMQVLVMVSEDFESSSRESELCLSFQISSTMLNMLTSLLSLFIRQSRTLLNFTSRGCPLDNHRLPCSEFI